MSDILVFIEQIQGETTDASLQLLTLARELSGSKNFKIHAILAGPGSKVNLDKVFSFGANYILIEENESFKSYTATPYVKICKAAIEKIKPGLILFPASTQGNDLASAVATEINEACVLDCKTITREGDKIIASRVEFDNKVSAIFSSKADKALVVSCKDGIVDAIPSAAGTKGEVTEMNVTLSDGEILAKVIRHEIAKKSVNLKAAKIIVTAGAGIGSKENYKLIEDLAKAVGGEVGATRPVVDAGWATADRQIGQTGTTVKPDLYIACGVSGAVQHRVGMMDSKKIIAINTDPSAPIFKIANYAIVGDLHAVIPKIIKLLA